MGRDCASERVPIALAEADQRTPGRRHQRRLTSPPLPSRGAHRQGLNGPAHPIKRLTSRLPPSQAMRASGSPAGLLPRSGACAGGEGRASSSTPCLKNALVALFLLEPLSRRPPRPTTSPKFAPWRLFRPWLSISIGRLRQGRPRSFSEARSNDLVRDRVTVRREPARKDTGSNLPSDPSRSLYVGSESRKT